MLTMIKLFLITLGFASFGLYGSEKQDASLKKIENPQLCTESLYEAFRERKTPVDIKEVMGKCRCNGSDVEQLRKVRKLAVYKNDDRSVEFIGQELYAREWTYKAHWKTLAGSTMAVGAGFLTGYLLSKINKKSNSK